jgi:hypothetical protein
MTLSVEQNPSSEEDNCLINFSPLWNRKIFYHTRKTSEMEPVLSQFNPVDTRAPSIFKICLNVVLQYKLKFTAR